MTGHRRAAVSLRADCSSCHALCCVVPAFSRSAQFAITKAAGTPCPNLDGNDCSIHAGLRDAGFSGCAAYDCFGAGQRVTAEVLGGRDWRGSAETLALARQALPVARRWHEVAWHLDHAARLHGVDVLRESLIAARDTAIGLATRPVLPDGQPDLDCQRIEMDQLLRRASELARAPWRDAKDLRGASLVAADLSGTDLRGADLRGAVLLGADLRRAKLEGADLTGADLRAADLRDADLWGVLFCTSAQLESARGNAATRLPVGVERPAHWRDPGH